MTGAPVEGMGEPIAPEGGFAGALQSRLGTLGPKAEDAGGFTSALRRSAGRMVGEPPELGTDRRVAFREPGYDPNRDAGLQRSKELLRTKAALQKDQPAAPLSPTETRLRKENIREAATDRARNLIDAGHTAAAVYERLQGDPMTRGALSADDVIGMWFAADRDRRRDALVDENRRDIIENRGASESDPLKDLIAQELGGGEDEDASAARPGGKPAAVASEPGGGQQTLREFLAARKAEGMEFEDAVAAARQAGYEIPGN